MLLQAGMSRSRHSQSDQWGVEGRRDPSLQPCGKDTGSGRRSHFDDLNLSSMARLPVRSFLPHIDLKNMNPTK